MGITYEIDRDNFWARVDIKGENDCWLWTGAKVAGNGYGKVAIVRNGKCTTSTAHRVAWELTYDCEILVGWECHHVCGNRLCCFIGHLDVMTREQHLAISNPYPGFCNLGLHKLEGDNIRWCKASAAAGGTRRRCRECENAWYRERRAQAQKEQESCE